MRDLMVCNSIINNDVMYLSCANYNGLFEKDLLSGEIRFDGYFPEENIFSERLHCESVFYNNLLVFCTSKRYHHIHFFDLNERSLHAIDLCLYESNIKKLFIYKGILYVLVFYLEGKTIEVREINCSALITRIVFSADMKTLCTAESVIKTVLVQGNYLLFAISHTDKIVKVDLKRNNYKIISSRIKDLFGIFGNGDHFYISSYSTNSLFGWNGEDIYVEYGKTKLIGFERSFINNVYCYTEKHLCTSSTGISIYEIDDESMELRELFRAKESDQKCELDNYINAGICGLHLYNGELLKQSYTLNGYYVVPFNRSSYRRVKLYYDLESDCEEPYLTQHKCLTDKIIKESEMPLRKYIEILSY